jgi:hypothetical protein
MCNSASDADCDGGGPGSASSARPQADGIWTGPIVTMFSKGRLSGKVSENGRKIVT